MGQTSLFVERSGSGSVFVLFYKLNDITEKWMLNDYIYTKPCSAKSCNNGNPYSIHLHLCMNLPLLFHETITFNEAQVPLTGQLCEV